MRLETSVIFCPLPFISHFAPALHHRRPRQDYGQHEQAERGSQTPSSGAAFDYFPAGYSQSADDDRAAGQVSLACHHPPTACSKELTLVVELENRGERVPSCVTLSFSTGLVPIGTQDGVALHSKPWVPYSNHATPAPRIPPLVERRNGSRYALLPEGPLHGAACPGDRRGQAHTGDRSGHPQTATARGHEGVPCPPAVAVAVATIIATPGFWLGTRA